MSEAAASQPAPWFVRHGSGEGDSGEIQQLSESELQRLLRRAGDRLGDMFVRQGHSDWYPAKVVLKKFERLANEGIYLRCDGFVDGPFTAARALQLLSEMESIANATAKVGIHADWVPASRLLNVLRQSSQPSEENVGQQVLADAGSFEDHAALPAATREEDVDHLPDADGTDDRPLIELVMVAEPVALPQQPAAPVEVTPQPRTSNRRSANRQDPSTHTANVTPGRGKRVGLVVAVVGVFSLGVAGVLAVIPWLGREAVTESDQDDGPRSTVAQTDPDVRWSPQRSTTTSAPVEPAPPPEPPPQVPPATLFRPAIQTTMGNVDQGVLFAARVGNSNRNVLVGAANLLGPDHGLRRQLRGAEVAIHFQQMQITDLVTGETSAFSGKPLRLRTGEYPSVSIHGDVVVFEPDNQLPLQPLPISAKLPEVGERVWLLAPGSDPDSLVQPARFQGSQNDWLRIRLDDAASDVAANIGAAIINGDQAVIGIKVADVEGESGVTIASPIRLIIPEIQ